MVPRLSKSKYLSGLQCVKKLWLSIYAPDKASPLRPFQEMVLSRGTDVGELARKRFPAGKLVEAPYYEIEKALEETSVLLDELSEEPKGALFEPAFLFNNIFVRVDVLRKRDLRKWDIIEVKSTLDVQDIQLPDAAVQRFVVQGSGLDIGKTCIMHLDRECEYPDLSDLFVIEEVDELIWEELEAVPAAAETFLEVIARAKEPDIPIGDHCNEPYECQFKAYCWQSVPSPSIFNIRRLNRGRKKELIEKGILGAKEIPPEYPLAPQEMKQVEMYRKGAPEIETEKIEAELRRLSFPLYFLDFETDNPAVPRYEGTRPYQQVPFQYSLHILAADGGLEHREYLHTDTSDPRRPLAERLIRDLESNGRETIIAYYAVFEKNVIRGLAGLFPDLADELLRTLPRFWDLLDIFKKYYRHPKFLGSNSLKSVLPVIVPEMSYAAMDVQNGPEAQLAWNALINDETPSEEKEQIEEGLRIYCRQDTMAMVEIYRRLLSMVQAMVRANYLFPM
jgi:hypothetical protein